MKPTTICWDCARAINGCNWSIYEKSVEGWTAEPTQLKNKQGVYAESFCVISCPEFLPETERKAATLKTKGVTK